MKRTFYRPHERVQELGLMLNHGTGELYRPPSRTKQEFKKEADINNIIKSFSSGGMAKYMAENARLGAYQDLPDSYEFQESMHMVERGRQAFMSLPAKIRDKFGNDPAQFLAFTEDPRNLPEMRAMGLANPEAPSTPTPPPQEKTDEKPSE